MRHPLYPLVAVVLPLILCTHVYTASANEISFDQAIEASTKIPKVEAAVVDLKERIKADQNLPSDRGRLTLNVAPGRRLSPTADTGNELMIGISQGWNLGDLSKKRRTAARAERQVISAEHRVKALAARMEAALRWFDLRLAEQAHQLVQAELANIAELEATIIRARKAGVVTRVAEAEAKSAHADAKRLERTLEGERVASALALCVAIGALPDIKLSTAGPMPVPTIPSEAEISKLEQKVEQLPQIALRRLQSVASSARAAEQKAANRSTLSVGVEFARESTGSTLLFGTLGWSFAGADKNQRQRSLASAQALRRLQEAKDVAVTLRAELADAIHEVEHSEELWQLINFSVAPASESLLKERERQLALGEGTLVEVLRARSRVTEAKRYLATAGVARRWSQVHLWLLLAEIKLAKAGER